MSEQSEHEQSFEIHMTTLASETITVNVEASDPIDNVKDKIQGIIDIPFYEQKLLLETQPLEDDKTLADYNILKVSLLTVIRQNFGVRIKLAISEEQTGHEPPLAEFWVCKFMPSLLILKMVCRHFKLPDLAMDELSTPEFCLEDFECVNDVYGHELHTDLDYCYLDLCGFELCDSCPQFYRHNFSNVCARCARR